MEINVGLRLLVLSLSCVLLMLVTYYFLVINRSRVPGPARQQGTTQESERQKADAALMSKIKSAIAQTKRLHGYNIGVECKDEAVTLNGEVPTEIDKELAGELAKEIAGSKEVHNLLRVSPEATPQPGENKIPDFSAHVDDLELQANLREQIRSVPELKAQAIEIKALNRVVTLTGNVASESQKIRAEQLLRNYPKVTAVQNGLRIGSSSPAPSAVRKEAPPPPAAPATDQELTQAVRASLRANQADFSAVNAIQVSCQNGVVTLAGTVAARAERALTERLAKEVAGVQSVRNRLTVGAK